MGIRDSVRRRALWSCALALVLALVTFPGVAFAADAKFYYKKPAASSTTSSDMPKIAVYIVDRYGIKYSSNFRVYVDGVRKTPKISYKSRYKKVWIAYYTKTRFKAGTHKVTVKVKNVRGHWSTTYWYFKVRKPAPPTPPEPPAPDPMPVTIESTECHACHLDTSWHPMDDCQQCHGEGRPVSWSSYTPADESAHTPGCAAEQPCHGGGYPFPHVLWADCTRCHNGSYENVASSHAVEAEPAHLSTSALCTKSGCHLRSLTTEHYRRTVGGARLTCATCHSSTDRRVRLALEAGSTRCESCHALTTVHVAPPALHVVSGGCVLADCHGSSGIALHGAADGPGCAACHAGDRTASRVCADCHSGDVSSVHESALIPHTAVNATCITSVCHSSDVATIHSDDTGPGCVACHAAGRTPSTLCVTCHPGTVDSLHPNVGPDHTAPVGLCVNSRCHINNVMKLHNDFGEPGCKSCHKAGAKLVITCTTCHAGDVELFHPGLATKHTATSGVCTMGGCHGTKARVIHDETGGPGCVACHADGKTASTTCSACHLPETQLATQHPRMKVAHVAAAPSCVSLTCHVSNVGDLHAPVGCIVCHATKPATTACATCHGAVPRSRHQAAAAKHIAPTGTCVSALCHVSDVITLHTKPITGPGCAACHANGKTASLVCSNCHVGDVEAQHPRIGVAHTAPASGCVGSTCHVANVAPLHKGTDVPGCGACHLAGTSATIVCATCHPGDLGPRHPWAAAKHIGNNAACQTGACHPTDVAKIHEAGLGCVDCHGPGKTASTSCATCHSLDIASLHPKSVSKHTASAGTCVSSVCHGTSATALHKPLALQGCPACHRVGATATLACRSCHTPTLVSLHAVVAATDHAAPVSTCVQAGCHGSDIASLHKALAGEGCASCHIAGKTLTQTCRTCHVGDLTPRHTFADPAHRAPSSECVTGGCHVSNISTVHAKSTGPGCEGCHAPGKTRSLTCSKCHVNDATLHPKAAAAHAAVIGTCVHVGCHLTDVRDVHGKVGGPGCIACHADGKTASLVCENCHALAGLTLRHAFADSSHTAPADTCISATCHLTNVAKIHDAGLGCVDCHGVGKTPSRLCGTCHAADRFTLHPKAAPKHVASPGLCTQSSCHGTEAARTHKTTAGYVCEACHTSGRTPSTTCASCHSSTLTSVWHPAPASLHTAGSGTCVTGGCHRSDVVAVHWKTGCLACHAVGKTPSLVCSSCHAGDITSLHPKAAISHGASASCIGVNCHVSDVSRLHGFTGGPGCIACHADGKSASTDCSRCHPITLSVVHDDGDPSHAPANTCTTASCHIHGSNVASLHSGAPLGCRSCHTTPDTVAKATCSTCHVGDVSTVHTPYIGTKHAIASTSCKGTSNCHNGDAAAIHTVLGEARCFACHGNPNGPALTCSTCHGSGFPPNHPAPPEVHTSTTSTCIQPTCHASNVGNAATIHTDAGGPGCIACHSETATKSLVCVSCHNRGLSARHPSGAAIHTVSLHPCTDAGCHVGNVVTIHEQDEYSCWVCHDDTTGQGVAIDCRTNCHGSAWAADHAGAQGTDFHGGRVGTGRRTYSDGYPWYFSTGYLKPPYTRGMSLTCSVCHVQAGTTNVFDFPLEVNGTPVTVTNRQTQLQNLCVACHGGTATDWHASCFDPEYGCHVTGHGGDLDIDAQDCSKCHHHGLQNWPHGRLNGFGGPTL